ncbi:MAG TPA: zinc-ribbon domain containing protein [Acidobacteriaceae bacterium]|nr:zinc-ribbon domain containing protein [Acidobacteriaceae bacterium]
MEFTDRILKCSDCGNEFIFTAGEQLFFYDKQFKNDPKRCKLCKAKRAGLGRTATTSGAITLPLSRTETRTKCSACGVETTVPFKPTQGRPVLCRSCFQLKRVPTGVAAVAQMDSAATQVAAAIEQVMPNADGSNGTAEAPTSAIGLIAQTPVAVISETADAPSLVAAAAEAPQA